MTIVIKILLPVIASLCFSVSVGQAKSISDCDEHSKVSSRAGSAIGVDEDGNVWLSGFGRRRTIGQDIRAIAFKNSERQFIPSSDIPISREQFTCGFKGWKLVAFATVHPIVRDEIQSAENRLVVVLFRGSAGKVILQKIYPQIIKVTLADINGDGAPGLAVQWSDGALISPAFWLDIWRINGEGMIAPVDLTNIRSGMDQEMASHGNTIELGDYTVGDLSIYSEQRVVKKNAAIDTIRKQYIWNNEKATYEFKSKTIIEEKILTD